MPKARLELARAGARQILSLLRLPIPPLGLSLNNIIRAQSPNIAKPERRMAQTAQDCEQRGA